MPSSGNGPAISPERAGHDRAREQPAVLGRASGRLLPTTIAMIRHAEAIPLVVILNCFPIAWPAGLLLACIMPPKEPR
jgi:hypothetical protein